MWAVSQGHVAVVQELLNACTAIDLTEKVCGKWVEGLVYEENIFDLGVLFEGEYAHFC